MTENTDSNEPVVAAANPPLAPPNPQIGGSTPKKKSRFPSLSSSGQVVVRISTENAPAVLKVVQAAAKIAAHVPYLEGMAGVLNELLQIREVSIS